LPWILNKSSVAVNESYSSLKYPNANNFLIANKDGDPRVSIFERLSQKNIPSSVDCLWVAIPHPDADKFAKKYNLKLNYSYSDFLVRNNKLSQKELFGSFTPNWHIIDSKNELKDIASKNKQGFIKREYGSGGYAVFDVNKAMRDKNFLNLFRESDGKWYFEEFVAGKLYSIQCLIDNNNDDITIFGFSEQQILDNKYFAGSKILPLDYLHDDILIQLQNGIKSIKPLLKNYTGFLGIDFITDKENKINILEANIRATAATIPTLLTNMAGGMQSEFKEDLPKDNIKNSDIILTEDLVDNCVDVLHFCANKKEIGKFFFLDFKECAYMPMDINNKHIKILSSHIENSVSDIVSSVVKNFWPFGWTEMVTKLILV
jgi:hypothetical protein